MTYGQLKPHGVEACLHHSYCRNRHIPDRTGYHRTHHGKWNKLSGDHNSLRLPGRAPYISVNNTKLHSATIHRATGQVMVPDPPSGAQEATPTLNLRLWKINNKPQGFPGAAVHQVFAVLLQNNPACSTSLPSYGSTDRRKITKGRSGQISFP